MHPEVQTLIDALELAPHPEGGYFRETFRSTQAVGALHGRRVASTAIYFLLPAGSISALHRVRSDEVWHHYAGDPLDLHLLDDDGGHRVLRLGLDFAEGEQPQAVVPAGVWQAAVPTGTRYALCGCTVAPGFEFVDFDLPTRQALIARFPSQRALIEKLTRA